jgi:hypothetical protein
MTGYLIACGVIFVGALLIGYWNWNRTETNE